LLVAFEALSENLILINTNDAQPRRVLSGHTHGAFAHAWSADERTLITGGTDNALIVWDVSAGTLRKRLKGHTGGIHRIALSPDGARFASSGQDNTIRIWDTAAGTEVDRFENGLSHHRQSLMWLPDGKGLQLKWPDGSLAKLDLTTRKTTPITVQGMRSDTSVWTHDGKWAAGVGPGGLFIDYRDGQKPFAIPGGRGDDSVAWLPDNERLAISAPQEFTVRAFDSRARRRVGTLLPVVDGEFAVISRDGHIAGSSGIDERLLYIAVKEDGTQTAMTRSDFEVTFGWKNDPSKAWLLEIPSKP
jgi:WD40 repeat protein